MTTTITGNDIITALRAAIEYRGLDYVYETVDGECVYREQDGTPSCLFGIAFDSLGILPDREEVDIEGQGVRGLMVQLEDQTDVQFDVTTEERRLFSRVQTYQDESHPYREVLGLLDDAAVPQGNSEL